jgi:hypothetical protein
MSNAHQPTTLETELKDAPSQGIHGIIGQFTHRKDSNQSPVSSATPRRPCPDSTPAAVSAESTNHSKQNTSLNTLFCRIDDRDIAVTAPRNFNKIELCRPII